MKRQRNRRGFTLAETLAALVVVVLLAMSVQIGAMTALRAFSRRARSWPPL